jgi:hypothetical protein
MKRLDSCSVLFVGIVASCIGTTVYADCTEATLSGGYVATNEGTIFDDRLLTAGIGVITFDGVKQWSIPNPTFVSQGRGAERPGKLAGTYQVNADCSGVLFLGATTVELAIGDGGNEVRGIVIPTPEQPPRVVKWMFKRQ